MRQHRMRYGSLKAAEQTDRTIELMYSGSITNPFYLSMSLLQAISQVQIRILALK
jgi:hypothetical protein